MGNTKSQARGFTVARGGAPVEDDPFAELADIFESELQHDPRFADSAQRKAVRGQNDEFGFDGMDREFEAAFETDLAAARKTRSSAPAMPAYETRFNGRTTAKTAASGRKPSAPRPTHLTDEEIDHELEAVLRNLSTPAKPRDRIVVETQSFAPERTAEERPPLGPQDEVDEFEELIRSELAVIRPAISAAAGRQARYAEPVQYDDGPDDHPRNAQYRDPLLAARSMWKRRLTMGASAVALLLVAGAGFAAWQGGSAASVGADDGPLLIKADAEPYKIMPKDPGGRAYPNQNKAVYDRVAAPKGNVDTPMQQALLKNVEEPMDLPADDDGSVYAEGLPGVEIGGADAEPGKDQTRVSAATEAAEESVLQPRKVRTMTVGPDGKLIAAEMPAVAQPAKTLDTPDASSQDIRQLASLQMNAAQPAEPAAALPQVSDPVRPAAAAVPAARPAPQAQEVASLEPQAVASAMPAGGFFVQVASQPTEAAAQQSLRNFGGRYGAVVAGRPVGIQAGEVAGKGTYWRVRVAASTKEEAASLCAKLKSAGASCFVTR